MRPAPIIAALVAVLCTATIVYAQNAATQPKVAATQPEAAKLVVAPVTPTPILAEAPKLVSAPTVSATDGQSVQGLFGKIKKAAKDHRYRELVALILTAVMFLWRRFGFGFVMHKLNTKQVGWLTILIAFLGTLPAQLLSDSFSWGNFIWDGCVASGEAMLLWQTVLKGLPWFKVPDPATTTTTPATTPTPAPTSPPVP